MATTDNKVVPPKKGMSPATLTMLVLAGCFFLSLIMASGALQYILTVLCLLCIVGFGVYQIKHRKEEEK